MVDSAFLADADGNPIDFWEYNLLKSDEEYCRVALTGIGDVVVSTVWIGVPMLGLYETMVLRDGEWGSQTRWDARDAAEMGHNVIVLAELPGRDVTTLVDLWKWAL